MSFDDDELNLGDENFEDELAEDFDEKKDFEDFDDDPDNKYR